MPRLTFSLERSALAAVALLAGCVAPPRFDVRVLDAEPAPDGGPPTATDASIGTIDATGDTP